MNLLARFDELRCSCPFGVLFNCRHVLARPAIGKRCRYVPFQAKLEDVIDYIGTLGRSVRAIQAQGAINVTLSKILNRQGIAPTPSMYEFVCPCEWPLGE